MLDFNKANPGTPPDLRPALTLFAAVIAQAIKDAGAPLPKRIRKDQGGGAGYLTEADVRGAVRFLFEPGKLELFSGIVGFEAELFREHLICGTVAPWETNSAASNDYRKRIRTRAARWGFLKETQRIDDLWRLRHAR